MTSLFCKPKGRGGRLFCDEREGLATSAIQVWEERTGASPHLSALAAEPPRPLFLPLLSHAEEEEKDTVRLIRSTDEQAATYFDDNGVDWRTEGRRARGYGAESSCTVLLM